MKPTPAIRVVFVTCGSLPEGRKIAEFVVERRLAACANVATAPVESFYWWKGKLERAREFQVTIKTTTRQLEDLEKEVKRLHSYEVAEFLILRAEGGSKEYLRWVDAETPRKSGR